MQVPNNDEFSDAFMNKYIDSLLNNPHHGHIMPTEFGKFALNGNLNKMKESSNWDGQSLPLLMPVFDKTWKTWILSTAKDNSVVLQLFNPFGKQENLKELGMIKSYLKDSGIEYYLDERNVDIQEFGII